MWITFKQTTERTQGEEGRAVFKKVFVSAEFRAFAGDESSPVTSWLRAVARLATTHLIDEAGQPTLAARHEIFVVLCPAPRFVHLV